VQLRNDGQFRMTEIEIRKYRSGDEEGVRVLIEKILAREFPEEAQHFPTDDLKEIPDSYGKLGEAFFVACKQDEIIGTVGVKQEDSRTALLRRLYVDGRHRRHQLGGRLIDCAIAFCREVGYEELIFKTTSSMKDAVQLGARKGFTQKAKIALGSVELVKFALFLKKSPLVRE